MNWLNYHHLYYFWLFSKEGSVSAVANKLNIAQSAVSGQLVALENSLGIKLFDRTNKKYPKLTEEGKSVLEFANNIFETGEELKSWVKSGVKKKKSTIRIGTIPGLSRNFLFEFIKPIVSNKDIKVEIITADANNLLDKLNDHSIDVILSSRNLFSDKTSDLKNFVLDSSPLLFVINKQAFKSKQTLKEYLINKRIYIPGKNFEARAELEATFEKLKVKPNIAGEIDDIALLRLLAVKTNEIVAIPEMGVINELKSKEIKIIKIDQKISQKFYAITREKKVLNSELLLLIENLSRK